MLKHSMSIECIEFHTRISISCLGEDISLTIQVHAAFTNVHMTCISYFFL